MGEPIIKAGSILPSSHRPESPRKAPRGCEDGDSVREDRHGHRLFSSEMGPFLRQPPGDLPGRRAFPEARKSAPFPCAGGGRPTRRRQAGRRRNQPPGAASRGAAPLRHPPDQASSSRTSQGSSELARARKASSRSPRRMRRTVCRPQPVRKTIRLIGPFDRRAVLGQHPDGPGPLLPTQEAFVLPPFGGGGRLGVHEARAEPAAFPSGTAAQRPGKPGPHFQSGASDRRPGSLSAPREQPTGHSLRRARESRPRGDPPARPAPPRPVVNADPTRRWPRRRRSRTDGPQHRILAPRRQQTAGKPLPRAAAKRCAREGGRCFAVPVLQPRFCSRAVRRA